jgi:hypothetical protein
VQRGLTEATSSRFCWYSMAADVAIDVGGQLTAHVSGIARCGSPWACPACSPVVRERRAVEIDPALSGHLDSGGGAEFVTLTLQHHSGDSLASRLDVVSRSQQLVLSGEPWKRRRARLGFLGGIKAVEITYSERNGWHPHSHSVWLFERPLTVVERYELRTWLLGRWRSIAARRGLGVVSARHGVDVAAVTSAGDLAGYLTKVEGGWGAALELARSDLKRSASGMTPLDLLRSLVETGEAKWAARWSEYERATFGKRAIVWSPGLRARLTGVEDEASDVDLAASEGIDLALLRALVPKSVWDERVRAGGIAGVLSMVEQAAGVLLAMAEYSGANVQPIGAP